MSLILGTMHPEDIKAAIRKAHGSVDAFAKACDLPATGVYDLLRGRPSKRVADAIERVIQQQSSQSRNPEPSEESRKAHLLNGAAS